MNNWSQSLSYPHLFLTASKTSLTKGTKSEFYLFNNSQMKQNPITFLMSFYLNLNTLVFKKNTNGIPQEQVYRDSNPVNRDKKSRDSE